MASPVIAAADTVAFDMDGTLVDSTEVAVQGARVGLERFFRDRGIEPLIPEAAEIRRRIGMPSLEYFAALVPPSYREEAQTIRNYVSAAEERLLAGGLVRVFPGALGVLGELRRRGYRLVLVSNCGPKYFRAVRSAAGLEDAFERAYCVEDAPRGDKASALERALGELGSRAGVMVGDKKYDLDAARANGLRFVGCRYGFACDGELDGADAFVDDLRELPGLLPERAG